jgi:hypothetical protein
MLPRRKIQASFPRPQKGAVSPGTSAHRVFLFHSSDSALLISRPPIERIQASSSLAVRRGRAGCSRTLSVPEKLLSYARVLIAEGFYSEFEYLVGFKVTIPYFVQKALFFAKNIPVRLTVGSVEAGNIHPNLAIQGHEHDGEGKNITTIVQSPRTNKSEAIDPDLKLLERHSENERGSDLSVCVYGS